MSPDQPEIDRLRAMLEASQRMRNEGGYADRIKAINARLKELEV